MRKSVITLILLLFAVTSYAQIVKGIVYEDENNNQIFDRGESPIDNILLSNGHDFTQTNANGEYSLDVSDGDIVFVVKPADYNTYIDELNIPRFYYIYKPEGSPELKFGGIKPTGGIPESVNFPLYKTAKKDKIKFLAFGDPQPGSDKHLDFMRDDVISEVVGTDADFVIALGDIVSDNLSLYPRYNEIMKTIGVPIYNVPGNHDQDYDAKGDENALDTFKETFGPANYSFNVGYLHIVVLDNIIYHGENKPGNYDESFSEAQLEWLKKDLSYVSDNKRVILTMHGPIYNYNTEKFSVEKTEEFLDVISVRENLLVLSGHYHTNENLWLTKEHGWTGTKPLHNIICGAICGSWWRGPIDDRGLPVADQRDGAPNGHIIFNFDKIEYSYKFKAARFPEDYQMKIALPKGSIKADSTDSLNIYVNVFNADANWKIECTLDGESIKLSTTLEKDPQAVELYERDPSVWAGWIKPVPTGHLYKAPIGKKLDLGIHEITVMATDPFGEIYRATRLIEVVE